MILYNQNIWGNTDKPIGNRHILIREMVDEIRPDVVTLQECNPARSRVGEYPMQEMLKPEYLEVLPEKADVNFAPVFYRTETLDYVFVSDETKIDAKSFEVLEDERALISSDHCPVSVEFSL